MSAPAFAIPRSVEPTPIVLYPATGKEVAELDHMIWEERGRPHGSAQEDCLEAERWLLGTKSSSDVQEKAE